MTLTPLAAPEGTRLLLIRHGQTEWNAGHRVQGQSDAPLDAAGRAQAQRLARRLCREPIAALHASDLCRAVETARPLADALGLSIRTWSELRELGYGPWEGLTAPEIERRYPQEYRLWRRDRLRFRMQGVETLEELHARTLAAGRAILAGHGGETVAVVAHAGTLRALLCALLGWPIPTGLSLRIDNAAISRVEYTGFGPLLALWNDTAHLTPTLADPALLAP